MLSSFANSSHQKVNDGAGSLIKLHPKEFNSASDIAAELRQFAIEFKDEINSFTSLQSFYKLLKESKLLAWMPEVWLQQYNFS